MTTTQDQILDAITGVGRKVDTLSDQVQKIDKRVTALEQKPALKTRVVTTPPPTSVEVRPQPAPGKVTVDQAGGDAEKYFQPMLCTKLAVSKDRKRENWRVDLYLQGLRRPASVIEWQFDALVEMVEFIQIGWPQFSMDHLDESWFIEADAEYRQLQDDKIKPPRKFYNEGLGFMVEAMKSRRDAHNKTYINAVAIYPFAERTTQ
ncbi:MAG: hypothetical protein KDJ52_00050 [Anaerolineae bacterium]|nr:hypothetical protein [Anaerolineae bacterium]